MADSLSTQMDFTFFVYGLAFLLLATVCLGLARNGGHTLPWKWLALFGLLHGVNEWLDMLALSLGSTALFTVLRSVLMAASFVFLAEFGRAGLCSVGVRAPGRWILLPLVALAALGGLAGPAGLNAAVRYSLGTVGGLASAWVLFRAADLESVRHRRASHVSLLVAAVTMAVYAVATGLVVPAAGFPPAVWLNQEWFLSAVGVPVQLARGLLAAAITVALWVYFVDAGRAAAQSFERRARWQKQPEIWLVAVLAVILAVGWSATEFVGRQRSQELERVLLTETRLGAAAVDPGSVLTLTSTTADVGRPNYERLKEQIALMRRSDSDIRYVYLVTLSPSGPIFAVDDTPPGNPDYAPPGLPYRQAPPGLLTALQTGKALVEGPYVDKWGTWKSGFVPVYNRGGDKVLAVLGMDTDYSRWAKAVAGARVAPIALTLLLALMSIGFYLAQHSARQASGLVKDTLAWKNAILDNSSVGILALDEQDTITQANPRLLEMFGFEDGALVGRNVGVLNQSREEYEELSLEMLGRLATGEAAETERQMRRQDGSVFWCALSGRLVDREDRRKGEVWVLRDVDKRQRAEEALKASEQRFRAISTSAFDAIIMIDGEGAVTFWNEAAERMFGYPREEAKGRDLHQMVTPTSLLAPAAAGHLAFRSTGFGPALGRAVEMQAVRKDGATFPVELSVAPVSVRGEWHAVSVVRDITERKQTEEKLKKMAVGADAANRAKSEFLANMSHEIRTPMNGVIGMTGLLLDTHLDAEQREYAETVQNSAEALLVIINDILDFSKIEAGRLELECLDFDLRRTLDEISNLFAARAAEKGLEFIYLVDPAVPAYVRGDPGRIRQILVNLAENAIKFTAGGEVATYAGVDSTTEKQALLRFLVTDTGIGVAPEKLESLFEPFVQADASITRTHGGTGLGLAISRQLAEMMGGEIGAWSTEGGGSTFWFTIRVDRCAIPPASDIPRVFQLTGRRILVVDDNRTNRRLLALLLDSWGCEHEEASDGPSALHKLRAAASNGKPCDLAVLDMMMPGMDGETLGRQIKADPVLAGTLLLMMTSAGHREDRARMLDAGFSGYLVKPVKQSELFDCLADLFALTPETRPAQGDRLPSVSSPASEAGDALTAVGDNPARILLAEDNRTNQKVALRLLEKLGYHADVATTGNEVLRMLVAAPYDLVLMDVQMPEMDGLEATRLIRDPKSGAFFHDIPIVAITAHAMAGDRENCLEAGMDDYLSKPIDPKLLAAVVRRWLPQETSIGAAAAPEPGEATAPIPSSAGACTYDHEGVLQRLMGDEALVREVVGMFLEDAPQQLEILSQAVRVGDLLSIRRLAHGVKGAAANVGAEAMHAAALHLEHAADEDEAAETQPVLAELESAFAEFARLFENNDNQGATGAAA